jgi:NitT/TauT family transport system ATP-binding protein
MPDGVTAPARGPGPGAGPGAPDAEAAVAVRGVTVRFEGRGGPVRALEDVDLDVPRGAFVSIVGRSGCGKSTLLRVLAGLIEPTAGGVALGGRPHRDYLARRRVGFVFQEPGLLPWKSVAENVALPLRVAGGSGAPGGIAARVAELLAAVRLEGFGEAWPAQLSGGMRQRVALARALAPEPEILLMDEPFGALDEFTRREMHEELIRIWEARPLTVVFVTHSLAEALALSDRVVVMSSGPGRVREVMDVARPRPRDRAGLRAPEALAQLARLEELLDAR